MPIIFTQKNGISQNDQYRTIYISVVFQRIRLLRQSACCRCPKDDLASKGAAAFRETKANVENVIADAGEKGQQTLNYAGQKGQEAMDNVREVGDTLAVAIEKSVTTRPYTTLAPAVAVGFLFVVKQENSRVR